MADLASYRCTMCAENWPIKYGAECPKCGDRTWESSKPPTLDETMAHKMLCYVQFERYYEEREKRREFLAET